MAQLQIIIPWPGAGYPDNGDWNRITHVVGIAGLDRASLRADPRLVASVPYFAWLGARRIVSRTFYCQSPADAPGVGSVKPFSGRNISNFRVRGVHWLLWIAGSTLNVHTPGPSWGSKIITPSAFGKLCRLVVTQGRILSFYLAFLRAVFSDVLIERHHRRSRAMPPDNNLRDSWIRRVARKVFKIVYSVPNSGHMLFEAVKLVLLAGPNLSLAEVS